MLNGVILTQCAILKCVAASAAEAELGALFLNAMEARIIRLTLKEMGHPQPPTPIHVDNTTAVGIVNGTIKRQRSRAMNMRYFWLLCQEAQKVLTVRYHPGQENLGDMPTKHHNGAQTQRARPFYLQTRHSPRLLPRAPRPSVQRGCCVLASYEDQGWLRRETDIWPFRRWREGGCVLGNLGIPTCIGIPYQVSPR